MRIPQILQKKVYVKKWGKQVVGGDVQKMVQTPFNPQQYRGHSKEQPLTIIV